MTRSTSPNPDGSVGEDVEGFAVVSDGLRIVGQRWRPPASVGTIVMLHGGGQTRHSWDTSAAKLVRKDWSVVTYDARGHGDSDWSAHGDYGIAAGVTDLMRVLEHVDPHPVLVGASMGGLTALFAASESTDLASAVILVDIVARIEPAGRDRIRAFMTAHQNGFATLDAVADAVAAYSNNRRRPRNLDGLRHNVRQRDDGRWYWHWDPELLGSAQPDLDTQQIRIRTAAERITQPSLLVRGRNSDIVSPEGAREMLAHMPSARLIEVNAGHMVAGDDNDVFITEMIGFLDDLRPAKDPQRS